MVVYALVALRIALLLLPQNEWGTKGNYTFGLIRNIPFAILGILLILWTWKYRKTPGLQYTSSLIFASFLFYLPVVIGARFIPALGALMIPKTVAYVLLVVVGYKHFLQKFEPGNLFKLALTFAIMGLIGGVFYREFTKAYHWTDVTHLSFVHLHLITLGFLWLIIVYLFFRKKVHTKDHIPLDLTIQEHKKGGLLHFGINSPPITTMKIVPVVWLFFVLDFDYLKNLVVISAF